MNSVAPKPENSAPPALPESEATGLPGLRTWGAVYGWVLVAFVIWVGLLTVLSGVFS